MFNNNLSSSPLRKFDKLPLVEDGDVFRPEKEIIDSYFDQLNIAGYRHYEEVQDRLLSLQFTKEEVENVSVNGATIPSHQEWKREFETYCLNQRFSTNLEEPLLSRASQTKRTVLNKRNPFADVAIQDQSFLYPSKNGYETLSFTTNRHFIHKETEDGDIYAVVPGFKVSKQKSRERVDTIIATDSVSTLLPETKDNKRIVYI